MRDDLLKCQLQRKTWIRSSVLTYISVIIFNIFDEPINRVMGIGNFVYVFLVLWST